MTILPPLVLLIILILFAARANYKLSFLAASLLAAMAFSIIAFGDLERVIVTIGCAVGSLLVSIVGMRLWRKAVNLPVELDRISARLTELERAESRRLLDKVRSQDPKLNQRGGTARTEEDPRRELLDTGEAQASIVSLRGA
jgi:hypothetical protein